MYFISRININKNGSYGSLEIMDHAKNISMAKNSLIQTTKQHLEKEFGSALISDVKITDIQTFSQVTEPLIDSVSIYRLETDPNSLHIYQRKSVVVPGRVYGHSLNSEFRKSMIFSIHEYTKTIVESTTPKKIQVNSDPPSINMVPKYSPMVDLLTALKKSPKFLQKKELCESTKVDASSHNKKVLGEIINPNPIQIIVVESGQS